MLSHRSLRSAAWLAILAVAATGGAACAPGNDESGGGEDLAGGESPEPAEASNEALSSGNVQQAAANGCSTLAVRELSLQIIEEGNCITPDAYAHLPDRANLDVADVVFPYLEGPARAKLVEALDANPNKTMSVSSMLRTVAQQYMLYRWYQQGRCGIGLAAKPGHSNHETGLAIDIAEYSSWKGALTSRGFTWLGSADRPHFDYRGAGAVDHRGLDVLAFQRLWNRNHPEDTIDEDGDYGPDTESRIKQAPAGGFAVGATCNDPSPAEAEAPGGDEGESHAEDGSQVDGSGSGGGACGDACTEGVARSASCDACSAGVCAVDDYCCTTAWDVACVLLAAETASCGCGGGDDGGSDDGGSDDGGSDDSGSPDATCAHDEFDLGGALDAMCSECAGYICEMDDYCCDVEWDSTCVDAALASCE